MGRFEVKKEGEWTVETKSDQFLMYIEENNLDHLNRAIQGSEVIYEHITNRNRFSKRQFVQIVDVKYP